MSDTEKLRAIVAAYDKQNPMRTADAHNPGCDCLRCAMDNIRNLSVSTEWQDEIDRRDDIINSDKKVIADLHAELEEALSELVSRTTAHEVGFTAGVMVTEARFNAQLAKIRDIADQGGRRMETAMDACDKIMALCELHTTDQPDTQREASGAVQS